VVAVEIDLAAACPFLGVSGSTGVFTSIAVTGGPRDHLRQGGAFPGEEKLVLILEALQPTWRYVVLASRC
jgi:hypothetical protein